MGHNKVFGICENKCLVPIIDMSKIKVIVYPCSLTESAKRHSIRVNYSDLGLEFEKASVIAQPAMEDIGVTVTSFDNEGCTLILTSLDDTAFNYADVTLFIFPVGVHEFNL